MNFAQGIKYGPLFCKDGLRNTDQRLKVQYEAFEVRSMHGKVFSPRTSRLFFVHVFNRILWSIELIDSCKLKHVTTVLKE
jgi:hypothetical protein